MIDLISRKDAIGLEYIVKNINGVDYVMLSEVQMKLRKMPSAQPEIVRCKECINHGKEICYFWSHFYGTINTPDDGFCYKAERRTDE